jgi:hypothetical protein
MLANIIYQIVNDAAHQYYCLNKNGLNDEAMLWLLLKTA